MSGQPEKCPGTLPQPGPRPRELCVDVTVEQIPFEAWADARVPALLRFAYLVTGSREAADEAVQEALSRAYERWDRVSRTEDPDSYVRRMVVNAHVSAWRRFRRRELPVAELRSRPVADPAGTVVEADAVWRVCLRLPERQRAAVVLRFYEDLDYPEIAAILECSAATVRSHVHRALTALRTELARRPDDD